ncbi:MAG: hypothetical protein QF477_14255 [SAR202 cluster bacterium]|jgi:hypothetical protein|nr:hypothetical protein [SAR202 cluster bacterium]MDP6799299.1 hypothetical protein [SAR202 cluster bacterium]
MSIPWPDAYSICICRIAGFSTPSQATTVNISSEPTVMPTGHPYMPADTLRGSAPR